MKTTKILVVLLLTSILLGCNNKIVDKPINIDTNGTKIDDENKVEEDKVEENEMKNIIEDKNNIKIAENSNNINDLGVRNTTIVKEYINAIEFYKKFSLENNLNLTFAEPLEHRISRFDTETTQEAVPLLKELYINGAETINYFTNQDGLNVDLSISIHRNYETYDAIVYKASVENIDRNFNFKESKLNEFRSGIVKDNNLDFDKLNNFINDSLSGVLNTDIVFFNKIDDDKYEVIRVEKSSCYYRLVYDPRL
ncbi:MAG: hypothetical protein E7212_05080 [Clostridium sartagoforme]|nr:hypothetical protein [Clostridium sartagoforme]